MCLALAVQPPAVECRETTRFTEDAGDPDMPDRVESGPVRASGLTVFLPGDARLLELERGERSVARPTSREPWREYIQTRRIAMYLLRVWSSVASWRFAL